MVCNFLNLALWSWLFRGLKCMSYILYCFTEAKQTYTIFLIRMVSSTVGAVALTVQFSNAPIMLSGFV